ncbi:hypothetical protein OAO35_00270 [Euryarchaeota archaeon]|nr:hypothetical protein [Euryarchaeota archaeon]
MFAWLMHLMSTIFGNTAKKNMEKQNVKGADNTETGPDVPEDWYLNYEGPAPIVEDIYEQNYGVDRGNGAIPIDFYVKKWGVPKGFEEKTEEALKLYK